MLCFRCDSHLNDGKPEASCILLNRQSRVGLLLRGKLQVARISGEESYKFGWLQGSRKLLTEKNFWLRGVDLNHRPLGYEPNELPDCSTPHFDDNNGVEWRQTLPLVPQDARLPAPSRSHTARNKQQRPDSYSGHRTPGGVILFPE
jgi:hypothetical protein